MTESDLYKLAKGKVRNWTWERVESTVNSGQPDCILSHGWKCHRVELKIVKGEQVYFEPSQISFANRMRRAAVHNLWVLAYEPKKENIFIFAYRHVPEYAKSKPKAKKYSLHVPDVQSFSGWDTVEDALRYNWGTNE